MPATINEVTVVSDGKYFKSKTKPFPISGPKQLHRGMVTTSEHSRYQDNNNDDDGNNDPSLDDDGNGNTFQVTQGTL